MRNKFLKGLSVAFAAAMAFTVVAPALTTEAASSKAYVVSEKMDENGNVTKYTYDSRGRVTKEVTTSIAGTSKQVNAVQGAVKDQNKVETTVTINDKPYTTTTVIATTYDNEVQVVAADAKSVTTTNYTYYNSGKNKDQKKTKSTTNETYVIYAVSSTNSDNSYSYYELNSYTEDVAFTYDSKGNLIKDVTTTKTPGEIQGVIQEGGIYTEANIKATNALFAHNQVITETTKEYTVNSKGQTTRVDRTDVMGVHTERWNADNSEKIDGSDNDQLFKADGNYATWKYNKNGFPTEYVAVNANKSAVGDPTNGYTGFSDATDSVDTYKYTYGKDMQLQKKVHTGKNPANGGADDGDILTTVLKYNDDGTVNMDASTASIVNAPVYGNDFVETTTYNYTLKDGSTAKTYETANTTTVENGISDKQFDSNTVKYTLKKISVPSSRLQAVVLDQAMAQTAFDWQ